MTDNGSPYLRREPRSEAEAREDVLRRVVAQVRAGLSVGKGIARLMLSGWTYDEAEEDINAALREGGDG